MARFSQTISEISTSALKAVLGTIETEDYPLIGEFECTLAENLPVAVTVLEQMATAISQLPSFQSYTKRFDEKTLPRTPRKPDPQDPTLYQNPPAVAKQSRTHMLVWKTRQHQIALTQYQHDKIAHKEALVAFQHLSTTFGNDGRGYLAYCLDLLADDDTTDFFLRRPHRFPITEGDRRRHTYVTAGSGYGKTETLKLLLHHYLTRNTSTAVVIIDPHGDFALEAAQLKPFKTNDRLAYLNPDLAPELTPIINPFDLDSPSPKNLNQATNALIDAFAQILSGDGFSSQMEVLLRPCIATLLLRDGSTLPDLKTFMDDSENLGLLAYARDNLTNPEQRKFFDKDFHAPGYQPTKHSIRTRIQSLLNDQTLLEFTGDDSTIDLKAAIDQRKVIIIDTSCGDAGGATCQALSRLILARLVTIAMQRTGKQKRVPIHLFIDECQLVISSALDRVMSESRKFGLHATLAQQVVGYNMDAQTRDMVLANTNIKITGNSGHSKSLEAIAKATGGTSHELRALRKNHFNFHIHQRQLNFTVAMPGYLVGGIGAGNSHYMTAEEWKDTLTAQKQRYYRATPSYTAARSNAPTEHDTVAIKPARPIQK